MAKKTPNIDAGTITFDFDGSAIVFDIATVPADILRKLAIHGASQKIGDSYAGAKGQCEETDMDPNDWSLSQASSVIDQLVAGEWNVRASGGEGRSSDLAVALSEVVGCTIEDAIETLNSKEAEDKKALRAHPDIKAVLDRLRLERQTAKAAKSAAAAGSGPDLTEFMS